MIKEDPREATALMHRRTCLKGKLEAATLIYNDDMPQAKSTFRVYSPWLNHMLPGIYTPGRICLLIFT